MFTLVSPDLQQQEITLQKLLERSPFTLLYFYPKNDTPGCTLEANDFTSLHDQFTKKWIQVVGVSKDTPDSHCSFITKHWLKPLYISDPELILHKQFGARGEKNNYGKVVTWVIRSTILLDNQWNIRRNRHNVRATGHADKILKELSTLASF